MLNVDLGLGIYNLKNVHVKMLFLKDNWYLINI